MHRVIKRTWIMGLFVLVLLGGMLFFLGIGNTPALHTDDFQFNEQVLLKGVEFFEDLAQKFE